MHSEEDFREGGLQGKERGETSAERQTGSKLSHPLPIADQKEAKLFLSESLSRREEVKFQVFLHDDINPVSGARKNRRIYNPNQAVREVHMKLRALLDPFVSQLRYSRGFVPGESKPTLGNVREHGESQYFYLTDLHSAYQNVDGAVLAEILANLDPLAQSEEEWFEFLVVFCLTKDGGLITGAPGSPDLFNLYAAQRIDRPLGMIARWNDLIYTRYLDDLTFSSQGSILIDDPDLRKGIRETITMAGFDVHHRKSVVADLAKGPIVINGIGLELGGRTFLPRHYLRKLAGLIHLARKDPGLLPKVHGMMGVFWSSFGRDSIWLNSTERRIWQAYKELCQLHK